MAGLVDGLKPYPPPLSSQKNEILVFGLCSTSDDQPGWLKDSNPICHPSSAKKMKCSFLDYIQLLMTSWPCQWTQTPSSTPLQQKKWNTHFWLHSTSDDRLGWLMDGRASWWTQTLSTTPLQPKKWNAHFWITFNFWWPAGLVDGLEPHLPPLSNQKNEMLIFWLRSTSDDCLGWSMDSNTICHLSPAKKLKCSFLDYVWLLMIGRAINGLEPHLPALSSQKNEMLIFQLHSTSDDQSGWSIDSNPICHLCPTKKMKCSFLDYVQLLMIGRAGWWTQTPFATSLQPQNWNACFWIMFNFWWSAGLFNGLEPHPTSPPQPKNEMLILGLRSNSDD